MILRIDPTSETAVYRQIVDGLRIALVGGELAPGDALPSVRRLALDLGVNFNTVAQAYRALSKEGWLEIGARAGVRVKARSVPKPAGTEAESGFRRRIEELIAQMQAQGVQPARLARELRRILGTLEGT
jgi:GntR family transcriptional regulator